VVLLDADEVRHHQPLEQQERFVLPDLPLRWKRRDRSSGGQPKQRQRRCCAGAKPMQKADHRLPPGIREIPPRQWRSNSKARDDPGLDPAN
jgi:hypothetical protein